MAKDSSAPADFVRLFTDGACSGNPGPGGWAYILEHPTSGQILDASGAEPDTTNNRMELTGAIEGLSSLKRPCRVELITDSQYVAKGIAEWLPKWKAQGWQRKEGGRLKPVMNVDLWRRVDELLSRHQVRVTHVLGHNGHPENEACDRMAVAAYKALMNDLREQA
jgi:ribonuclease HI